MKLIDYTKMLRSKNCLHDEHIKSCRCGNAKTLSTLNEIGL